MRVGPPTEAGQDLQISHWDTQGTLIINMSWDDWDELVKDADYFRKHGRPRPGAPVRTSSAGNDLDGHGLWIPPRS